MTLSTYFQIRFVLVNLRFVIESVCFFLFPQPSDEVQPPTNEPLRITIRQNSDSTGSVVLPSTKLSTRPVVTVTPTPSRTIAMTHTEPPPQKSTAVVTPLLRTEVLPDISDDSLDDSFSSDEKKETVLANDESKQTRHSRHSARIANRHTKLKKRSEKRKTELSGVILSSESEDDNASSSPAPWVPKNVSEHSSSFRISFLFRVFLYFGRIKKVSSREFVHVNEYFVLHIDNTIFILTPRLHLPWL